MLRWLARKVAAARAQRAEARRQRRIQHEVAFLRGLAADARRRRRPHVRPSESPRLIIEGEEVGYLESLGYDLEWPACSLVSYGRFHPLPAFEKHRGILDRVEGLSSLTDQDDLTDEQSEELDRELRNLMRRVDAVVCVGRLGGYTEKVRDFRISGDRFRYTHALSSIRDHQ